ncbi:MAG: hypothetical protein PF904_00835 [Kiritimatiellae bacterium]|jgi:sialate O-acetylesterase|nr:hypothetical protein [Kiritimatiellia bacterium]
MEKKGCSGPGGREKIPAQTSSVQKCVNNNDIPVALYNGFVHALAPYALKGAIWYQGESNAGYRTEHYRGSMLALIKGWRERWGQDKFCFYWCQLAN